MSLLAGMDIGGTKCAVVLGLQSGDSIEIVAKKVFSTAGTPGSVIRQLSDSLESMVRVYSGAPLAAIGISCGGPLDISRGLICCPPNLPGWDKVDVVKPFADRFHVPVRLQNDANACALAEWMWGAGRSTRNMIFLTFGTGMGAGLILNGRLYGGSHDMAGEIGHMRLEPNGPSGYGKNGSFEGFCSGGGIAQLAKTLASERIRQGKPPLFCRDLSELTSVTAHTLGDAARQGDPLAMEIFDRVGRQLGRGLAVLVDLLNPEKIVIGSIYLRQRTLLEPSMRSELQKEALPLSLSGCEIVPAGLGEQVGDYASLSVARDLIAN